MLIRAAGVWIVIAPGFIDTDMTAKTPEEALAMVRPLTPLACLGTPDEVAIAVRFLADPRSSFTTGQVINADGGMYMEAGGRASRCVRTRGGE